MLTEVVEQGPDIRIGCGDDRQTISGSDLCHNEESPLKFEDSRLERPLCRAGAEPTGMLHQRGSERRERFRVERSSSGLLDREAVATQQQDTLNAGPLRQAAHHLVETGHAGSSAGKGSRT